MTIGVEVGLGLFCVCVGKDGGGDEGGVGGAGIVSVCRQCGFELLGVVRGAASFGP